MGNITKISKAKMDEILNNYNVYTNTFDAQNQTNAVQSVKKEWWGDNGDLEVDLDTGIVWETQSNGEKVGMGALDQNAIQKIKNDQSTASNLKNRELDQMLRDDKAAGSYNKGPQKEESKGQILRANSVPSNKTDLTFDVNDFLIKKDHTTGSPSEGNYGKYDTETVIGQTFNSQLSDGEKRANFERDWNAKVSENMAKEESATSTHVGLGSLGEPITEESGRMGLGSLGEPITEAQSTGTINNANFSTTHNGLGSLGENISSSSSSTMGQSISGVSTKFGKFDTTTPIGKAINGTEATTSSQMFNVNKDFNINK